MRNILFEMEEELPQKDHSIWAERYRPSKFEDFIGSEVVKETLKVWLEKKDIPHLFLYGSAGGGKTSMAKLIIKNIPCDSLIINASDENGVDSIRNKVQDFAMTVGLQPIKIILLDECDRLTPEAMSIMRNLMETYSYTTRFILTANYHERVSAMIKSRCQSFEIKPPSMGECMAHLIKLLTAENIRFKKEDVAFIIKSYFPDLRKIINFAQQSSINGELKIAKVSSAETDYKLKLIELLKTPSREGIFTEIRQLVADATFSNYDDVYKFLFDHVNEYSSASKAPESILIIAEALRDSSLVFEREITFVSAMYKLLKSLK